MSSQRLRSRLRSFDLVACALLTFLLAVVAWLPGQEAASSGQKAVAPAPNSKDREQRLEAIEKSLQTLLKEVQSLKQPASAPSQPATGASAATSAKAPPNFEVNAQWLKSLNWRCLGPANMGGRITDIAVNPHDPSMWWVATASGGLLKTINNGTTFEHQFDHEATVSIGAITVAPSDANTVWVGTGEANPRNSV